MDGMPITRDFSRASVAGSMAAAITPVLLSGGSGTRLWPMSREQYPKQFLGLCSDRSMLQDTALRVLDPDAFQQPLVVCSQEHRFIVAEQLRAIGATPHAIVLEPVGRNTAAACAIAALHMAELDPDAVLLVLPADHLVRDVLAFRDAIQQGLPVAATGRLVTFGLQPTGPETGYGYIRKGDAIHGHSGAHLLAEFIEKPSRSVAEALLEKGNHLWNSGMFLFKASTVLAEFEKHAPAVLDACRRSVLARKPDLDFVRLDPAAFASAPSLSFDQAVMERTDRAAVIPCDLDWADVGSWSALWDVSAKDARGNVEIGDVVTEDARNCYVRSEGRLTAVVGLDNAVVVVCDDAVLVAGKERGQDVKALVDRLKRAGRSEPVAPPVCHRPWGSFQSVHSGERFQVKCLMIEPGGCLSLQKHYHRAEHWIVVKGTALVTRNDEKVLVYENQSIDIPMGAVHRVQNPGKVPLSIIEVQCGGYLGEDDIVRLEDTYGRAE